ncbi:MAG: hypothetical protein ACRDG4_01090 [Chloroflexota bacterium]
MTATRAHDTTRLPRVLPVSDLPAETATGAAPSRQHDRMAERD